MQTTTKRDIFRSLFSTGTFGCAATCHCGVHHFDNGNQWDDEHMNETLPNAETWAKQNPKQVQFHGEAIEYLNFNGHLYVIDCHCKMDEFIFSFLNESKDSVLSYYLKTKDAVSVEDVISAWKPTTKLRQ